MKVFTKLMKYLLIIFLCLMLASPVWIKNVPLPSLLFLTNKAPVIDNYICKYPVKVSSDSMVPVITPGDTIELTRCFDENDLKEGIIVLYNNDSGQHLGIIRHVLNFDPVVYKISNERPRERLQDMIKEDILAINQEINTSVSGYKTDPEISLTLNPSEFLSDFYLGKIPKGFGVEMAEVAKTNIFFKDKDKFCMVLVPKKELAFVDIEIVNTQTKETVNSSKNIVFNVNFKPNTNCQDFGTDLGMLNLNPGSYRYRFLLNHQVLRDIQFELK